MSQVAFVVDIGNYAKADLPSFISVMEEVTRLVNVQLPVRSATVNRIVLSTTDIVNSEVLSTVIEGGVAGNHTLTGIKTTDRLITVGSVANDPVVTVSAAVAGGAAGALTVTGVPATGVLKSVTGIKTADQTEHDFTSEFTITALNTIDNTGGTATTGYVLTVTYHAAPVTTVTDLTSEFGIAAADTIRNTTTSTAGKALVVVYERN